MDLIKIKDLPWCKPDWSLPVISEETKKLFHHCSNQPQVELTDDVEEIIQKSKEFPIPFPIETIRLETLKASRPIENLKRNIISTYPIMHERVLYLMANFLKYKRAYGTSIEKALYKNMTVPELIDRLLRKRAVTFVGKNDSYQLLSGVAGINRWESIGSLSERSPLLLKDCLSYDEVKLSAHLYVSGYTECINDGERRNCGVVNDDNIEREAVIIGAIGPRFKRIYRMDYEDIVINSTQNSAQHGYGDYTSTNNWLETLKSTFNIESQLVSNSMKRQLWCEFFEVKNTTYNEIADLNILNKPTDQKYLDRYVKIGNGHDIFDNETYYKRICILAETVLLEADRRAEDAGKFAYLNVVGCGLGNWLISDHQHDLYVLICLERIRALLEMARLDHVSDVNFAFIKPTARISDMFTAADENGKIKKMFSDNDNHPKGGINVQMENRAPSAKLPDAHAGKLLVITYPWDGNAHPGNEFWGQNLSGSGDSAAASSTQVSELHNAHINPAVCANNARIAGRSGIQTLSQYCEQFHM